uniref:Uncharacterized protein n=1 Tax=Oryza meridionalis TaxID=40149 RepID=A0A0E0EJR2_9ORYZ
MKRAASCFFSSDVNLSSNCVRQDKPMKLQPPLIEGPIFVPIFGLVRRLHQLQLAVVMLVTVDINSYRAAMKVYGRRRT